MIMATITITEFAEQAKDVANRLVPVGLFPALTTQTVTGTTTSVQSSTLHDKTHFVRIVSDLDAVIEIGTNPTASASTTRLPADQVEYLGITPGDSLKIAVKDA